MFLQRVSIHCGEVHNETGKLTGVTSAFGFISHGDKVVRIIGGSKSSLTIKEIF
jgi:hypothetical protein